MSCCLAALNSRGSFRIIGSRQQQVLRDAGVQRLAYSNALGLGPGIDPSRPSRVVAHADRAPVQVCQYSDCQLGSVLEGSGVGAKWSEQAQEAIANLVNSVKSVVPEAVACRG